MMNKNFITAAVGLGFVVFLAVAYYKNLSGEAFPGENKYRLASRFLEDEKYDQALPLFDEALTINPDYKEAWLGRAITLMQMERFDESRSMFERAIEVDGNFAEAYANRGILNDRTGHFRQAMEDYRNAAALKPELTKGPGRLWKFFHNVAEKIPSIADRADYIEAELKKPEEERVLRIPEIDAAQEMYKK